MTIALFNKSLPEVEVIIAVTLGMFLALWGTIALISWLRTKPWQRPPAVSEPHPGFDNRESGENGERDSERRSGNSSLLPYLFNPDVLPHRS